MSTVNYSFGVWNKAKNTQKIKKCNKFLFHRNLSSYVHLWGFTFCCCFIFIFFVFGNNFFGHIYLLFTMLLLCLCVQYKIPLVPFVVHSFAMCPTVRIREAKTRFHRSFLFVNWEKYMENVFFVADNRK